MQHFAINVVSISRKLAGVRDMVQRLMLLLVRKSEERGSSKILEHISKHQDGI